MAGEPARTTTHGQGARRGAHVTVSDIVKTYGAVRALDRVSLDILPGSIHALVGENGAGKSTLGRIIGGAVSPDSGSITVDGVEVSHRSPRDAIRHGIAMVDQELAMVPALSALDNVFLGAEPGRRGIVDRGTQRRTFAELAARLGLERDASTPVAALRVAEQQKIEMMRALVRHARLIVLDEPTAALTRDEARRLLTLTRELADGGVTIVFVSHFLDDVLALCDTITVLKDGRHVETVAAAGASQDSLVTAMIGRELDLQFPERRPGPDDAPVVLSVRGLARPPAFEGVDLEIREGEIVGLAGLVGSGRSEIARAIFGADPADGVVELDGRPLTGRSIGHRIRAGLGMLPESRKDQGLVMLRSVSENVTLVHLDAISTRLGLDRRAEERVVSEAMARCDVRAASASMRVSALSGGNQQKISLAKWLVRTPRILIADEPTRGIDIGAKLGIHRLLTDLAAGGLGILLISSEIEEVLGLAHRVLVLRQGRIIAELPGGTDEDIVMRAAFGGAGREDEIG